MVCNLQYGIAIAEVMGQIPYRPEFFQALFSLLVK